MHKYGWLPDKKDFRDYIYKAPSKVVVPGKVDLRAYLPPVMDQSSLGSCVWNALGNAHLYCQLRQEGGVNFIPSRLFGYYNSRDFKNEDTGCYIRDAAKSIGKIGVCPEALWPYDISKFAKKPPAKCYKEAEKHQAVSYWRLSESIKQLQKCLAEGFPVVLGISLYESFESNEVAKTGVVPFPEDDEHDLGGHAILCCLPKTMITTKEGFIAIEDVEIGDEVLTHTGNFKKVTQIFKRHIKEEIYKIKNNIGEDLLITKEHPVLTKYYSPQTKLVQTEKTKMFLKNMYWEKAENLKEGNLLYSPVFTEEKIYDGIIYENDFFELLGMYIGDGNIALRYSKNGNIKSGKLRFSLGKNYKELIERCTSLLSKYSKNKIGINNFENHINLVCYDTNLSKLVGNLCGFAKNKNIPFEILSAPKEYQRAFLKGWYETDGCRNTNTSISIHTAEYNLMNGLLFILKRLELLFGVVEKEEHYFLIKGRFCKAKKSYDINLSNINEDFIQKRTKHRSIYNEDSLIFKIKHILKEQYEGEVYNLEVEDDNSYLANNIAVHNCVGYDNQKAQFICMNSWSENWGDKGFFYIGFDYIQELSSDWWTIRLVEEVDVK